MTDLNLYLAKMQCRGDSWLMLQLISPMALALQPLLNPPSISPARIPKHRSYSNSNHRHPRRRRPVTLSPRAFLGSNGSILFSGGGGGAAKTTYYERVETCLVVPPPPGRRPRALVKFIGGAFVGAVPEVTYSHLMELLAKEGYLIVSVPYNVTFDHERAATEVYENFRACMKMLSTSGLPRTGISAADLFDLPLYSVGHSNGALLQLLVGSYFSEKIPKANAIISFNNRPVTEAVPYFDQLGPVVRQATSFVEAFPLYSAARDASGDAWNALLDTAKTVVRSLDEEAMVSFSKFVDQLPSVFNQVAQGVTDFRPTPLENRDFFRRSYNVPHTLLVKFSMDAIDETDLIEDILRPRVENIGGTLDKVVLSGNHLTPCIQDLRWQVRGQYTPADALAQSLKSLSLADTRSLARTVADWLARFES